MAQASPILSALAARQPKIGVPFLDSFRVHYGPGGLLGRFFISADSRLRERGITLGFISFDELNALGARNSDNWGSPNPMFNPRVADIPPGAMCLAGFDAEGVIRVCACAKPFDATRAPFSTLVNDGEFLSLRGEHAINGYVTTIDTPSAFPFVGLLGYCSTVWVHPEWRGTRLASIIAHLMNACMLTLWNASHVLGSVERGRHGTGLQRRYGYLHSAAPIKITKAAKPVTELVLLWMTSEEAFAGLGRYLDVIWPEIDAAVSARNREQPADIAGVLYWRDNAPVAGAQVTGPAPSDHGVDVL